MKLYILVLAFTFTDILLLRDRTQYTQSTTSFLEKESLEAVRWFISQYFNVKILVNISKAAVLMNYATKFQVRQTHCFVLFGNRKSNELRKPYACFFKLSSLNTQIKVLNFHLKCSHVVLLTVHLQQQTTDATANMNVKFCVTTDASHRNNLYPKMLYTSLHLCCWYRNNWLHQF